MQPLDDAAVSGLLVNCRRNCAAEGQSQQHIQRKGYSRVMECAKSQCILNRGEQEDIGGRANGQRQKHR